jgi:hypothetical protein
MHAHVHAVSGRLCGRTYLEEQLVILHWSNCTEMDLGPSPLLTYTTPPFCVHVVGQGVNDGTTTTDRRYNARVVCMFYPQGPK